MDHAHSHSRNDRKPDKKTGSSAEMFGDVPKLVSIIRRGESRRAERAGAVAAFVNEFCVLREMNFPAGKAEAFAEIHVFIPRGHEALVEAADGGEGFAPNEERGSRCLADLLAALRSDRHAAVLPNHGPWGRQASGEVLLVNVSAHRAGFRVCVKNAFEYLDGALGDGDVGIENEHMGRRRCRESLVEPGRESAIRSVRNECCGRPCGLRLPERIVLRCVVDDDNLNFSGKGLQAGCQPLAGVPIHNHYSRSHACILRENQHVVVLHHIAGRLETLYKRKMGYFSTRPVIRLGMAARIGAALAIGVLLFYSTRGVSGKPKEQWKTGYWVWAGEPLAASGFQPDVLYVEVKGENWPDGVPNAESYVVVRRFEPQMRLSRETAVALARSYKQIVAKAPGRISGLQIDYDSPSGKLDSYAEFLESLRQELPPQAHLSITALLDWFRPSTSISRVIDAIDEFVPQFYDAATTREAGGIAEPIDASKWASIFNRYGTPYRIGVSTFGRISRTRDHQVHFLRDATPLDFTGRSEFDRSVRTSRAGELVLHYDVNAVIPGRPDLQPGDAIELTFPTRASVHSAYEAVREFGGYCSGVLFFRWPTRSETVTFAPDDVQRILSNSRDVLHPTVVQQDGHCLERRCVDLYIHPGPQMNPENRTVRMRPSAPLELFIPGGALRSTRGRSYELVVDLPAYPGLGRVYIGRAISAEAVHFEVIQP